MPARSPADRALVARIASETSWANTTDRTARTAPARTALMARFEAQVDPGGTLPPRERAVRAAHARRAHFARLALRSAQSRRKAREATAEAEAAEAALAELNGGTAP